MLVKGSKPPIDLPPIGGFHDDDNEINYYDLPPIGGFRDDDEINYDDLPPMGGFHDDLN